MIGLDLLSISAEEIVNDLIPDSAWYKLCVDVMFYMDGDSLKCKLANASINPLFCNKVKSGISIEVGKKYLCGGNEILICGYENSLVKNEPSLIFHGHAVDDRELVGQWREDGSSLYCNRRNVNYPLKEIEDKNV